VRARKEHGEEASRLAPETNWKLALVNIRKVFLHRFGSLEKKSSGARKPSDRDIGSGMKTSAIPQGGTANW